MSRWQVAAGGGQGRATVIVTHRLRMSLLADAIIVLDRGRIVEKGTPSNLLTRRGVFFSLWKRQALMPGLPPGESEGCWQPS